MSKLDDLIFLISQQNYVVGDVEGNKQKILKSIEIAEENNIDIVIFPETALSGYPTKDLLTYPSFVASLENAIKDITQHVHNTTVILGSPFKDDEGFMRNAALIIEDNKITDVVFKTLLPDYDVFDESRHFEKGKPKVVAIRGVKFGIQVCEDAWDYLWVHDIPVTQIQKDLGAECIINISASPYSTDKPQNRLELIKSHVKKISLPFIYVNLIGSQDDLVFDGRSFGVTSMGDLSFVAKKFEPHILKVKGNEITSATSDQEDYFSPTFEREWIQAICLNLRDYLDKSGLSRKLLIAVSGGIDSAITLYLLTQAVDTDNILAVYLPTKFSKDTSYQDVKSLCENLGVDLIVNSIEEIRRLFMDKLFDISLVDEKWGVAEENLQARIRAVILMYLSNKLGHLLISTGNKSEIAVGYCTLYGDTVGGKNLIGDLYKTQVYALADYINRSEEIIPRSILKRKPTAELKEDQLDTDTLPPYDILDPILHGFIEECKSSQEIIDEGHDEEIVNSIAEMIRNSEFKRAQMVQTVKLSEKAFGSGRKMPIANRRKY